jgi:hypothetical protein
MANPRDAGVPEVVEFFPVITEQVKVFCQTVDENPGLHRLTEHAPPNQLLDASLTIFSFCSRHYKDGNYFARLIPSMCHYTPVSRIIIEKIKH